MSFFGIEVAPGEPAYFHPDDECPCVRIKRAALIVRGDTIEDGARVPELLVDQGDADAFLAEQLRPQLLADACAAAGIPLTLRLQPGYDHSYYFVSTFLAEHVAWHATRLKA